MFDVMVEITLCMAVVLCNIQSKYHKTVKQVPLK